MFMSAQLLRRFSKLYNEVWYIVLKRRENNFCCFENRYKRDI